jgi:hypothetical protein
VTVAVLLLQNPRVTVSLSDPAPPQKFHPSSPLSMRPFKKLSTHSDAAGNVKRLSNRSSTGVVLPSAYCTALLSMQCV